MNFLYILAEPIAYITRPIYNLVDNYGLTLIIVTILIRLLTIPLTFMSQKSATKTQLLQPEIAKIQQKYKNDKEKMSTELQKLYTKNDINPMGGCLPLIVQMFILFGFINVVYNPLQYILQLTPDQINAIKTSVNASMTTYQVTLCGMPGVEQQIIELGKTPINFDFFGINLTGMLKGNLGDIKMWIFPALAVIATVGTSYMTKKQTSAQMSDSNQSAAGMSNSMMMLMPVMTAYFTYIMPAGMSLYWFISTAVQIVQQYFINIIVKKDTENLLPKGKKKNENH